MACPRCDAETLAGMRFCGICGALLFVSCQNCGTDNPPGNKFCGQCGALLTGPADGEPIAPRHTPAGELKQVTVLFCDVVDSTVIAERLGPEAMHELIRWFIDTALAEVHRYGGTAPQFTGDGFMALFGAPITHEDHVRRALLAALAIRDAVSGTGGDAGTRPPHEFQMHMGIHTGLVVFGSVGGNLRMDPTAIGDAANIAARLQGAADPGTILISEETRQLARGYARIEPVGPLTLKGKGEPIAASRLLGVSQRLVPDEVTGSFRPFVNRTSEIAILNDLVRPVEEGRGQAFGIVGEPGIGKSRLIAEFRNRLGEAMTWIEGRCLSYATAIPYLLVLDLLRSLCGIVETDTPEIIAGKLRAALQETGMDRDHDALLLLHLLGIGPGGDTTALSNPETVKTKAFEILRQLFVNSSRSIPLVLLLEDLHWIDKVSDEFLAFLAENVGGARLLLLATYRPGYRPPWLDKSYAGQLPLRPLSRADSFDVVRSARAGLEDPVTEAIVDKADGNPLYLEQLALHAGEARSPRAAAMVPNTIRDVVMARIDRLPDETKRLLQTASVIGREFSNRLLRAAWQGVNPIEPHLRELIRLEFIYEPTGGERTAYVFRHALTQETAYAGLLESYRRALHTVVGRTIEELYQGRTEEVAEQLALHFGRSNEAEKAVDYTVQAAEKAQGRWANTEALAYFEDALSRLDGMPDTEANRLRRIDAVLKQGDVRYGLAQYTEYLDSLEGIRGIVEETEDPRRRAAWHYWTGLLHSVTGSRSEIAIEHCREAANLASAHALHDVEALAAACLAQVYTIAGLLRNAIEAGERALAYFEARGDRWWAARTLWFLSTAANYLGEWEASLDYCRRGLDHGAALNDPRYRSVQPVAWWRMGSTYIQQGDVERGLQCCDEALALAPILPRDSAMAKGVRGYGQIKAGQFDAGIANLREALAWLGRSGLRYAYLTDALRLAEGHLRRGDTTNAQPLIQDILEVSRASGYLHFEGRACWLMGDCFAAEDSMAAEDYIENAMRILEGVGARNDLAKAMLTRAALRQRAGDNVMARQLLERTRALFRELGTLDEPARVDAAVAALDSGAPIPLLAGRAGDRRNRKPPASY
jgi:class 3 adenylate cyclase/tetratricopeptide (TPR) repeat protein